MARYDDPSFRESMRLRLDYNNMMSGMLGEHGIREEDIDGISEQLAQACRALEENRGSMRWRELPHNQDRIVEWETGLKNTGERE